MAHRKKEKETTDCGFIYLSAVEDLWVRLA